jgi:uncharacterized protein
VVSTKWTKKKKRQEHVTVEKIVNVERNANAGRNVTVVRIVNVVVAKRMGRPKIERCVCCKPRCSCFKPQGGGDKTGGVLLGADEFEALKHHDLDGLDQKEAAKKMKISQSTFARLLLSARKKTAEAIVEGKEININEI